MLDHHLPSLPPFEQVWTTLDEVFGWLAGTIAIPILPRPSSGSRSGLASPGP